MCLASTSTGVEAITLSNDYPEGNIITLRVNPLDTLESVWHDLGMSRKKRRLREQKPKNTGNRACYDAMIEFRRSSATEPHRNRAKYDRRDERAARQKGYDYA
jgi:hypothetical protein